MIKGDGLIMRDEGKFPPKSRILLDKIGDEKVESLEIFKYPISLSSFAKYLGVLENTGYDELMHLGIVINGKYILDKDAVLNFEKGKFPTQSTSTLEVDLNNQGSLSINQMIDNTRIFMGNKRFSTYKAFSWNCQDFIKSFLKSNKLLTKEYEDFIMQDLEKVLNNLPTYSEAISNFYTDSKAIVNRQQEGEGGQIHLHQKGKMICKY